MALQISPKFRDRLIYSTCAVATICWGLWWRSGILPLSPFVKKYGGDALWALLIYLGVRILWPRGPITVCTWAALAFCFLVEVSQLYHAPWIDVVRSTRLGSLALGSTFNWPDFPAYAVGIAFGLLIEWLILARFKCRAGLGK